MSDATMTTSKDDRQLGSESIGKLLLKLAVPAVLAQLVNALYNVVDRIYIGNIPNIGKDALTGVGVTMPIIMLISAFAALVSMGAAPRATIAMGAKDDKQAEKILGNSTTMLLIVSAILTAVFLVFGKDFLLLFGASENTIGYAWDYLFIYILGTVFVQLALGLNAFINAQGFAKTGMLTVLIGAVLNIVLDPIFIFVFDMGVRGAAIATVISQAVSAVWVVRFLRGKKSHLHLSLENMAPKAHVILPFMALGLSPFIMQATESLIILAFNYSLAKYGGDIAVGSMAILSSVMQFSMLPLVGLTQGSQPIISYNYGAKNRKRVEKTFWMLLVISLIFSAIYWLIIMISPEFFPSLFTQDVQLIEYTSWAIKIYMAVSVIFGLQIACQQTFVAIGNAKASVFLAVFRKIILLLPLIIILPRVTANPVKGVYLAEPVADIIAVSVTAILFFIQFRKAMEKLDNDRMLDGQKINEK